MTDPNLLAALQANMAVPPNGAAPTPTTPTLPPGIPPEVANLLANPPAGMDVTKVLEHYTKTNAAQTPPPVVPTPDAQVQTPAPTPPLPPTAAPIPELPPVQVVGEKKRGRPPKDATKADLVKVLLACAGSGMTPEQAKGYIALL